MAEEPINEEPIKWDDPSIPVQFFALRREVIRLNLLVEALTKTLNQPLPTKEIEQPGSKLRAKAWKGILKRHRKAIEQQALEDR